MKFRALHAINGVRKDNKAPVIIEIRWGKTDRRKINTKIYVEKEYFNEDQPHIKSTHERARDYNQIIDLTLNKIETWRLKKITEGIRPIKEIFDHEFNFMNHQNKETLNDFYREALEADKNRITFGTHKDQANTLRHLDIFGSVTLDKVNKRFVIEFDQYMTNAGLNPNSRGKHHKNLKKYIRRAQEFKLLNFTEMDHPYYRFRIPHKKSNRIYLTPKQLETLENLEVDAARQPVKDLFLWSCYTGQRYSDTQQFTPDNVIEGKLVYTPQKTEMATDRVVVPIAELFEGKAVKILERYGYHLPKTTNQEINRHLKVISARMNLYQNLSFHCSRHTFLTLTAFSTGNLFKLMQWGGLKRPEVAMRYIHLSSEI